MAKTTAPLLSFGASGQIAKTQVYGSWKGVPYARRHVIPANPQTVSQTRTRNCFKFLNNVYKLMSAGATAVWVASAKGRPVTDRNAFQQSNLSAVRGTDSVPATDLSGMKFSPGVNGGIPAVSLVTSDAGSHTITATLTAPSLPTGWTIVQAEAIAISQHQADTATDFATVFNFDATSPYAVSLAMGAAGTYAVFGWFKFMKADGSFAWGQSLYAQQVVA